MCTWIVWRSEWACVAFKSHFRYSPADSSNKWVQKTLPHTIAVILLAMGWYIDQTWQNQTPLCFDAAYLTLARLQHRMPQLLILQARDISESRHLFDHLGVLAPIMLALSAATPILKGTLVDTDVRWATIAASVDCRTPQVYSMIQVCCKSCRSCNSRLHTLRMGRSVVRVRIRPLMPRRRRDIHITLAEE